MGGVIEVEKPYQSFLECTRCFDQYEEKSKQRFNIKMNYYRYKSEFLN